jgi:uncharacterized protein
MAVKKALIFWGGWKGHTPEQSAAVVCDLLRKNDFSVEMRHGTKVLNEISLTDFDLIIPVITKSTIKDTELDNLLSAVRSGVGLAGFHGTMCDSFRNRTEYHFMTGGQWVSHPGDIIDYDVLVKSTDDPILSGLKNFRYRSEQYYMHFDPSNEVLATTRFSGEHLIDVEGVEMPVAWKRKFGSGKVFYSALGHCVDEFNDPNMRKLFIQGAQWASR